MLVYTQRFLA